MLSGLCGKELCPAQSALWGEPETAAEAESWQGMDTKVIHPTHMQVLMLFTGILLYLQLSILCFSMLRALLLKDCLRASAHYGGQKCCY